jgi:hypothetical protein
MTIQTAAGIVQRLGPCRMAIDTAANPVLARELGLLGCDIVAPDAIGQLEGRVAGFLHWLDFDTDDRFARALAPFATADVLVLHGGGQSRHALEDALFAAGWQRHPGGTAAGDYAAWTADSLPEISYHVRAAQGDADSLLRTGHGADAAIARYAMAAGHVRPGDHVLIDGAHGADGAAIIGALSRAGSIALAGDGPAPDHGADMIVAFEPDGADWAARLTDYAGLLKFDGRLILGWPAAPGHNGRPRDWRALIEAASALFLPETSYVHQPARGQRLPALYPVPPEQGGSGDWLILVASANPLAGAGMPFDHPAFPRAAGPWPELVDIGGAYDNPHLYRAMVQMGERIGHDLKLARLAECVIEDARADSADRGAALAVLGYRVLELRLPELAEPILPLIAGYVDLPVDDAMPAHVRRWRISLAFLAGRLSELTGARDEAKAWYHRAAGADWADFSPLLATKGIAAAFYAARLHLADGDRAAARACFRQGLDSALRASACPHDAQMGPVDRPLPFYLQELAEVIDMGAQCANALAHFDLWDRDPGLFWRQVDVRRFGLASWARDLERENARLRAA